jgi:hypothetical protein
MPRHFPVSSMTRLSPDVPYLAGAALKRALRFARGNGRSFFRFRFAFRFCRGGESLRGSAHGQREQDRHR